MKMNGEQSRIILPQSDPDKGLPGVRREDCAMTDTTLLDTPHLPQAATPPATLKFDITKYAFAEGETDLTPAQQEECLRTLWWIMEAFVDMSFGTDSVQTLLPEFTKSASASGQDAVEQTITSTQEFNDAASLRHEKDSGDDG
jgi:hypothetical protein